MFIHPKFKGAPPAPPMKMIRVWASTEVLRKRVFHPSGIRFQADINQSVAWPEDQFTLRRIADGTVLTHPPGEASQSSEEAQTEPDPMPGDLPKPVAPTARGGPGTPAEKPEKPKSRK